MQSWWLFDFGTTLSNPAHMMLFTELEKTVKILVYLTSLCVNWAFFGMSGPV
jgi:hypothetical protein